MSYFGLHNTYFYFLSFNSETHDSNKILKIFQKRFPRAKITGRRLLDGTFFVKIRAQKLQGLMTVRYTTTLSPIYVLQEAVKTTKARNKNFPIPMIMRCEKKGAKK